MDRTSSATRGAEYAVAIQGTTPPVAQVQFSRSASCVAVSGHRSRGGRDLQQSAQECVVRAVLGPWHECAAVGAQASGAATVPQLTAGATSQLAVVFSVHIGCEDLGGAM